MNTKRVSAVALLLVVGLPYSGRAQVLVDSACKTELENPTLTPLREILTQAATSLEFCRRDVRDYTCTLVSQERVNGQLGRPRCCRAKVRHERGLGNETESRISIYLNFQSPESMNGREVLLVGGKNDGKMLVRKGGSHLASLTALIEPTSPIAMRGNRYSIREFGIQRLIERVIEFGEQQSTDGDCQVKVVTDVEIDGRSCTEYEVIHPVQQDGLPFHIAQIYVDREYQLPIAFEAYDFPTDGGDQPVLMERYLYRDLKLNVGLTDADFDRENAEYHFR